MAFPDAPDIVFARMGFEDAHTLARARATGAYDGLRVALERGPEAVQAEVKASGLTGRGGAGFGTAQKWSLLPQGVFPRYVVVNGDESEPGTFKDRQLMERDPHEVIEGALICAYAVNAARVFLYVRGEMALAQERLATALNEAYQAGFIGTDILGSGWSIDVVLHHGAGAYVDETGVGRGQAMTLGSGSSSGWSTNAFRNCSVSAIQSASLGRNTLPERVRYTSGFSAPGGVSS